MTNARHSDGSGGKSHCLIMGLLSMVGWEIMRADGVKLDSQRSGVNLYFGVVFD